MRLEVCLIFSLSTASSGGLWGSNCHERLRVFSWQSAVLMEYSDSPTKVSKLPAGLEQRHIPGSPDL